MASHVKFLCTVIGTIHTTPSNNTNSSGTGASAGPSPSALAAVEALATLARNGKISHRPYVCAVVVAVLTRWACFDKGPGLAQEPGLAQGQAAGKKQGQTTKRGANQGSLGGLPGLSQVGVSVQGLLEAIDLSEGRGIDEEGAGGQGEGRKGGKGSLQKQKQDRDEDDEDEGGDEGFAALQSLASTKLLALLADIGHMTVAQLADTNHNDNSSNKHDKDATAAGSHNGVLVKGGKAKKGAAGSAEGQGLELAQGQGQGKELCVTLLDVAVATVRYLLTDGNLRLHRNDNGDDEEDEEDDDEDDDDNDHKAGRKITKPSTSSSSSSAVMVMTEEHSAVLAAIEAMGAVMPHLTPCLSYHHHHHPIPTTTIIVQTGNDGEGDEKGSGSGSGLGRDHRVRDALYTLLGQAVFHVLASEGKSLAHTLIHHLLYYILSHTHPLHILSHTPHLLLTHPLTLHLLPLCSLSYPLRRDCAGPG